MKEYIENMQVGQSKLGVRLVHETVRKVNLLDNNCRDHENL